MAVHWCQKATGGRSRVASHKDGAVEDASSVIVRMDGGAAGTVSATVQDSARSLPLGAALNIVRSCNTLTRC